METPAHLTVDLGRLDGGKTEHLRGELEAALLALDDLEQLKPASALAYDLHCELLPGDELLVRGRLVLPCLCICGRCGGDFRAEVEVPDYCESFAVAGAETLDLTESVREGIILALPSYPVCKEDCKGACMHCGKNLNEGPCGCADTGENSPWEVLNGLEPTGGQ